MKIHDGNRNWNSARHVMHCSCLLTLLPYVTCKIQGRQSHTTPKDSFIASKQQRRLKFRNGPLLRLFANCQHRAGRAMHTARKKVSLERSRCCCAVKNLWKRECTEHWRSHKDYCWNEHWKQYMVTSNEAMDVTSSGSLHGKLKNSWVLHGAKRREGWKST